jgi:hypothetical protein
MVKQAKSSTGGRRTGRRQLFTWVEDRLRPAFDSPAVGRYDAEEATGLASCPVCQRPMTEHTIDHTGRDTILNCPVPHPGAWDRDAFEPVNEFGMVIRRPREPTGDTTPGDERPRTSP